VPAIHDSFRFDFKVAILERDERSGLVRFGLVPDPDRYEWIEHDGERALYDRFDSYIIPERVLAEAAPTLEGLPSFFAPPLIKSAADYVESRHEPIARRLAGEVPASDLADPSGEFLAELAGVKHDFAIISIDLVGSTPLSASLSGDDYGRLIEMFLAELSAVVPLFRGHVLKYGGDGLIAFMPGPSQNHQNDLAIDCSLTMHMLVYAVMNPMLKEAGLPQIHVRIGVDAGEASVRVLGSSATKRHADIIGEVVNLTCKVEATAEPGEVRVGGVAAHSMHTHWRNMLESAECPSDWPYTDETGGPYPVFRVKAE
jgi:class 3 adenylate cyclase